MVLMSSGGADISQVLATASVRPGTVSLRSIFAPLANLLLSPVCIVCRTRILSHGLLCGACFA